MNKTTDKTKLNDPCRRCDGDRYIPGPTDDGYNTGPQIPCPECDGSGISDQPQ